MDIDWHDPEAVLVSLGRHIGMWRWEFASDRVQWSNQLLAMLGVAPCDFTEHFSFFEDRLHPDDQPLVQTQIERHLSTGQPYVFRCRLRHADGHYVTTLAQGSALRDADGTPVELVGTVIDMSNEVRVASELQESEHAFQSLAENVPGAIFRYVLYPDGSDEIEYMSPGCRAIWEISAADLKGDPSALWAVVLPEDLPAMQASVQTSGETGTPWHHQWCIRTASGTLKHLEGRGTPSRRPDGSILWNSLILDVSQEAQIRTELVNQQKMLGQAQKMESIGRIAGGIAHDFNNILAIVLGNAELLEDITDEAARRDLVEQITQACQRGSDLTQHLLSFARRSTLKPEQVDVDARIASIGKLVSRVLPENVQLDIVRTAGLWKSELDVAFLETSILNLCINARDAMPKGGKLTIETSNVRVSAEYTLDRGEDLAPGRYVLVAVTDTGVGIPEAEIEKITEPFYSTKDPDKGSGLGLAMVDGFVRQSRGAMRIYSERGTGTSIKLFLPALSVEQTADVARLPETAPAAPRAKARILVVEDEAGIRKVVRLTLERAGYDVADAATGDEALERYGDTIDSFDLMLTDVVMPGDLQGPALAQALTALSPALRVVFMSGYPNEAAVHGNGIRPADRFLMKPILRQRLLDVIEEALESRAAGIV